MVTPKSKRTDLAVPQWVATEWNKGTREKEQMATTLQEVNWDKALGSGSGYSFLKFVFLISCASSREQYIYRTSNSWPFQVKFVDEMQKIITSRKKVSIKKDQGWYSEGEMKQDLKWSSILS